MSLSRSRAAVISNDGGAVSAYRDVRKRHTPEIAPVASLQPVKRQSIRLKARAADP